MNREHSSYVGGCLALFYHLKLIALLLEIAEGSWEGVAQFLDGLEGVMKGDDGTITGVEHHVAQNVEGVEQVGIVTSDEVPHHYLILATQHIVGSEPHPSVRRTEEVGVDEFVGFLHIIIICNDVVAQGTHVVVGVVAHLMPLLHYATVEVGITLHILAHHEEGCLDAKLPEGVENEGRGLRYGTIVKGEIYRMFLWIDAPESLGVYPPEPFGWLFY